MIGGMESTWTCDGERGKSIVQQHITPHHTKHHNTTQHNTKHHTTLQHNTTPNITPHHNTTSNITTQHHNTKHHATIRHDTTQHETRQNRLRFAIQTIRFQRCYTDTDVKDAVTVTHTDRYLLVQPDFECDLILSLY